MGGKRAFAQTLATHISIYVQENGGTYYEPFLGGGAMALAVNAPMVLSDIIEELTNTYQVVKDTPIELARLLLDFAEFGTDEKSYYAIRDTEAETKLDRAARLVYLNAHCFNGVYRTNKAGHFNVPYGKKEGRITDELIERIGAASDQLNRNKATIQSGDFERFISQAGAGDFVYVDPPYDGTYSDYSKEGFCGVSQERLAQTLLALHRRGGAFIAHNSDTEKVRWWYGEWASMVPTGEKRSVSQDGEGRKKADCLLITNHPEMLPTPVIDRNAVRSL